MQGSGRPRRVDFRATTANKREEKSLLFCLLVYCQVVFQLKGKQTDAEAEKQRERENPIWISSECVSIWGPIDNLAAQAEREKKRV